MANPSIERTYQRPPMSTVSRHPMPRRSVLVVALAASVVAAIRGAVILADRNYKVAVVASAPLYSLAPHEYPQTNPLIQTLSPGQSLRVLRVRYGKDFEAFKVEAPGGRVGWVVGGQGVEVVSRGGQNGG